MPKLSPKLPFPTGTPSPEGTSNPSPQFIRGARPQFIRDATEADRLSTLADLHKLFNQ